MHTQTPLDKVMLKYKEKRKIRKNEKKELMKAQQLEHKNAMKKGM